MKVFFVRVEFRDIRSADVVLSFYLFLVVEFASQCNIDMFSLYHVLRATILREVICLVTCIARFILFTCLFSLEVFSLASLRWIDFHRTRIVIVVTSFVNSSFFATIAWWFSCHETHRDRIRLILNPELWILNSREIIKFRFSFIWHDHFHTSRLRISCDKLSSQLWYDINFVL